MARLSQTPRPAGSVEDARALEYMREVVEATGRFVVEESSFEFQRYLADHWSLEVDGDEVECAFALCSANTPRGGVEGELCRSDERDLEGKVALLPIREVHESAAVERLARRGAVAAVAYKEDGPTLVGRVTYPRSSIPCVTVSGRVGASLWHGRRSKPPKAEIRLRARIENASGTNLHAVPRNGAPRTLFTAHRDSRPLSPGAIDNASGSAFLLFLAGQGAQGFGLLSTDAEEYGLRGAWAFIETRGSLQKKTDVVNLDSIGSGPLRLIERSRGGPLSRTLNSKLDSAAREIGTRLPRLTTPRGSDCDVFREAGHRACWVRSWPTPTATTLEDTVAHVREGVLCQCSRLLRVFVEASSC
ncbi:MAG: M28 family peptidase [Thaumarchaeota archaeon]|nr:M28 family peptidase [Nitrososphaerota archaeon]